MDFRSLGLEIIEEYKKVIDRMNEKDVDDFILLLNKFDRMFFIGVGREGMMTRGFAMRMMHMGKEAHWIWDDTTPNIGPGDLLVATIGGGEIGHIKYVCDRAKQNGATVAIITGSPSGADIRGADFVLFIPAQVYRGKDDVVPSSQPMGNLFEQCLLMVLDIVVMLMVDKDPDMSFEKMEKRHRNVE